MKKIYISLFIIISFNSFAQEILTTAFGGELPTAIEIVDDNLYVATFNTQKLYRLDLNDPTNIELVANFTNPLWKIGYDSLNDDFYCNNLGSLSSVDLAQSVPITPQTITSVTAANGHVVDNNIIYVSDGESIYSYDISVGLSSYQLFHTDTGGSIQNPRVYNNELYYQFFESTNSPNNGLFKIDLSSSNPIKVLVSSNLGGLVQSSLVVNNYLYLGLEDSNKIIRLDLSVTSLPITPEILYDNLSAGVIGIANKNATIYYTSGNQVIYTFDEQVLNVDTINQHPISIYPNPVLQNIFIKGNISNDLFFTIYAINGIKIKEGNFDNSINISDLNSGLYFIKLNQNNTSLIKKIIKK